MMLLEWEDGEIVKSWRNERRRRERLDRLASISFLIAAFAIITVVFLLLTPGRVWS